MKNLCAQNNISKKECQIWEFESLIFWSKFHFWWDFFRAFSSVLFFQLFFFVDQPWWLIFLRSPASYKSLLRACESVNSFLIKISITDGAFCKNSKQLIFKNMNTNTKKWSFPLRVYFSKCKQICSFLLF